MFDTATMPPVPPPPVIQQVSAKAAPESVQGRATAGPFGLGQNFGGPALIGGGLSYINMAAQAADEIIPWSWYPYRRDMQLRGFAKAEPILAGAVYSMRSRIEALAYRLEGKPRAKTFYGDVLGLADLGAGFKQLIGKTIYDLLTQDNGAFWELVGAGQPDRPLRGPVVQINHMDSNRCWRTFDPDFPVIYYNPYDAQFHKMHYSRIVMMSNNTQPDELARGIGFCAVSRALRAVQIMRDIGVFKHEKISGNFTRAMLLLSGITPKQVDAAKQAADEETESAGLTYFRKIPVLASMKEQVDFKLIDFASLPDGFDTEKDTNLYVYALSLAFGVDAREFWPATASGATKADASVQHMKAQGKGIGDLIQTIEHALNWQALKGVIEFKYDFTDDEQDLQKTQVDTGKITNIVAMQTAGWITPQQGLAIAVSEGLIDPAIIQGTNAIVAAEDNAPTEGSEIAVETPVSSVPNVGNPQPVEQKAWKRTRSDWVGYFSDIVNSGLDGEANKRQVGSLLKARLKRAGQQSYIDGLKVGGVYATGSDLSGDDRQAIQVWLDDTYSYVDSFVDELFTKGLTPDQVDQRAEAWANKSLQEIYTAGMVSANENMMMEFVGDDGEDSCPVCTRLKGQRHRLKDWIARGLRPGVDTKNFPCGGWNCLHEILPTNQPEAGNW